MKEAGNGNHFILITEGIRDKKTGELRKTKLILFSEDFESFFNMIADTTKYVRAHPVPKEIAERQAKMWQGKWKGAAGDNRSSR